MDSNGIPDATSDVNGAPELDDNNGDWCASFIDSTTDQLFDFLPEIQMEVENNGEIDGIGEILETNVTQTSTSSREEVIIISSESDNFAGVTGENPDTTATSTAPVAANTNTNGRPPARKKYIYRHSPNQVEELETFFEGCNHPTELERLDLSRRLNMNPRQVKFWFQNRRTQMKTRFNRNGNRSLELANDKLREKNKTMRLALRNATCASCSRHVPTVNNQTPLEDHNHTTEEIDRFHGGQSLPLATGSNHLPNSTFNTSLRSNHYAAGGGNDVAGGFMPPSAARITIPINTGGERRNHVTVPRIDRTSNFWHLAIPAMDEFLELAMTEEPIWLRNSSNGCLELNQVEYNAKFIHHVGTIPDCFITEASKESGIVIRNSLDLVQTLMNSVRYAEMFPSIIGRTSTKQIICNGAEGTLNGGLHLMDAEFMFPSPLVPIRYVKFLRYCRLLEESVWAIVDISINDEDGTSPSCRRLPSGCLIQDLANGYCKVTWIEHTKFDGRFLHPSYKPLFKSALAFGAQRWMSELQRQSESLTEIVNSRFPHSQIPINFEGKASILQLAKRMTSSFCNGVCNSSDKWATINNGNLNINIRVLAKTNVNSPGEPKGTILNAATSVYIPMAPRQLFELLENINLRPFWDVLCNKERVKEIVNIDKCLNQSNSISLIGFSRIDPRHDMLILQEKNIDTTGALIVYAPVDIFEMQHINNGADSAYMPILSSGFAILPDLEPLPHAATVDRGGAAASGSNSIEPWWMNKGGSLLTLQFQVLVSSTLTSLNITEESIRNVNHLVSSTVRDIASLIRFKQGSRNR